MIDFDIDSKDKLRAALEKLKPFDSFRSKDQKTRDFTRKDFPEKQTSFKDDFKRFDEHQKNSFQKSKEKDGKPKVLECNSDADSKNL